MLQPFPHSMPKLEGVVTWLINISMFFVTIYLSWKPLYEILLVVAAYGWTATILYAYLVLFSVYYIFSLNTYPLAYALVLRWRDGSWPSTLKVWDSRACQDETLPSICAGCTRLGRVAEWILHFMTYTHVGSLVVVTIVSLTHGHCIDLSSDLEKGENILQMEVFDVKAPAWNEKSSGISIQYACCSVRRSPLVFLRSLLGQGHSGGAWCMSILGFLKSESICL